MLEGRLAEKTAEVVTLTKEASATAERLASWEADMEKLKSTAASSEENRKVELVVAKKEQEQLSEEGDRVKQQLADARFEVEVKVAEYERLRTENASSASAMDEIKRIKAKLAEEQQSSEAIGKQKQKADE